MGYLANYGYTDGSGDWYIRIDTELCIGCGDCVDARPFGLFELTMDESDPLTRVSEKSYQRYMIYQGEGVWLREDRL